MPTKTKKAPAKRKTKQADLVDKAFLTALAGLEKIAQERIQGSGSPVATGLAMVDLLKGLVQRIEEEIGEDSLSLTEAGYTSSHDVVGVGVGVL